MIFSIPLLQIVIDLSYFERFVDQPMSKQLFDAFLYVGLVPMLIILFYGFRSLWKLSRQAKYAKTIEYVLLSINIPRENEQSPKAVEHIFSHIAGTYSYLNFKEEWFQGKFTPPFSFEYVAIDGYTQFVIRSPLKHRDLMEAAIFSQYPDAEIIEISDYTQDVPLQHPDPEWDVWGTEFKLAKPSPYPIRTYLEFEHSLTQELKDPLASLLESLSRLKKGEQVWIQILVYPIRQEWMEEGRAMVAKMIGKEIKKPLPAWARLVHGVTEMGEGVVRDIIANPNEENKRPEIKERGPSMLDMSPGERKVLEGIETKISKIGFGVKLRVVYTAKRGVHRKSSVIPMIKGSFALFSRHDGNEFRIYGPTIPKADYFWQRWSTERKKNNIINNYANRSSNGSDPFILNIEELASIYHFPSIVIRTPQIKKVESRKVEPPFTLPKSGLGTGEDINE